MKLNRYLLGSTRLMFGVESFPAATFLVLLFLTPESPRWLVGQRRVGEGPHHAAVPPSKAFHPKRLRSYQ
jgi:hypothetical protein